ncbi:MAG: helix-turn-helix domain-containing protein [Acidipropionibacterium sp.]|jgi:excisionase family DNA binding protein|nr:helix-turn-helix domain-containing protein [Acidipropionibacterium sp.]
MPATTGPARTVIATDQEALAARSAIEHINATITAGQKPALEVRVSSSDTVEVPAELGQLIMTMLGTIAEGGSLTVTSMPAELTTSMAAHLLGISRTTLMKRINRGEIPAQKVGTHHRLTTTDVMHARDERRKQVAAAFNRARAAQDDAGITD